MCLWPCKILLRDRDEAEVAPTVPKSPSPGWWGRMQACPRLDGEQGKDYFQHSAFILSYLFPFSQCPHALTTYSFFLSFFFFLTWTIFKVFIEFLTILLLFYVLVYGPEACGILTPQPRIELSFPALEGRVLTTGPPGKSLYLSLSLAFAFLLSVFP